jgi:5-methylthioadenosine/S-adenosylhomocysteine deaminase
MNASSHDLGIRCGHLLTMAGGRCQDPETDRYIGIKGGSIVEISPWDEAESPAKAAELIDGRGYIVMPGLVNAHAHLAMTLFRGLEDDVPFHTWLIERILPLEAQLVDAEFVRVGTELAALECIRFGVTTVNDMYFFAETVADVLDRAGLRGYMAQVFADGALPEDRVLGRDKAGLFRALHAKYAKHPRLRASLGPHAPYTCGDDIWREVVGLSKAHDALIHTHLCETAFEVSEAKKAHGGKTPVRRLHELGVLGPRTICAHCVHFEDGDFELMKSSGAAVVYNPDSNMKLSSGVAPVVRYRQNGIPVAFGTDGSASNNDLSIFGAMDVGTKLQKLSASDNTAMVAADALRCATWEGARALGLESRTGSIEVGKAADIILVGLDHPHMHPLHDVRSQLVYSAQGLEVDTVICEGRVLMCDRKFQTLNAPAIYADVSRMKEKVSRAVAGMRDAGGKVK